MRLLRNAARHHVSANLPHAAFTPP